jgi:phosphomannomutase/phosphoglucomutase
LTLLEFVARQKKSVSAIIAETPSYISSPTLNVSCADQVKYQVSERLTADFEASGYRVSKINGAKVYFPDGWGLVRASSNLPVLVLRFEARTEERLEEMKAIFREKFSHYPEIGDEWETG